MTQNFFLFVLICLTRAAGGGLFAARLTSILKWDGLPEILLGACYGGAVYFKTGSLTISVASTIWSYGWMETGHGTVLQWGTDPEQAKGARRERLSGLVDAICCGFKLKIFRRSVNYAGLGIEIGSTDYCRIFMLVKGFLIGLPVGGIVNAILWTFSYEIGYRVFNRHEVCEMLTGCAAFISIILYVLTF